jgi:hypothetical protein
MRGLGLAMYAPPLEYLLASPEPGHPHLPPTMTNTTLDQALDVFATSFRAVVFYGICLKQHSFEITFERLYFEDAVPNTPNQ